ncbi:hypothetical protein L3Q82_018403, partial [Scortum barcoo]
MICPKLCPDADSHLNLTLNFKVDGFNYIVFVTSETMHEMFWLWGRGASHPSLPRGQEGGNRRGRRLLRLGYGCNERTCINASKRKKSADKGQGGGKTRKTLQSLSDEEEEAELTVSQEERITSYSVEKIRRFLAETKDLYMSEFTDNPEVSQHFHADLPQVDPEDNIKLEAGLSLAELHAALMSLQNGKVSGPGVETPLGLLYSAESRWTGTERIVVSNGLEEGERFVHARFLSQRVYGVDSAEEAETRTDGLPVLAAAGASVVRWTPGYSGLGRACAVKKVPYCKGQELVEPGQIRRRAVEFYRSLCSSEYEEDNTLQEEFCSGLPQVSTETNSRLAEPLRLCELQAALQSMQGQRAPGIDGLTVEFYKAFWDILAADILDVFNESLTYGSMPVSCRRAVLTLLPKKGNLQDIKNWRPVSLLCVDYKLLSKALANRLRGAMEQIIHHGTRPIACPAEADGGSGLCELGLVTEVFPDNSFQSEVWTRLKAYAKLPPNSLALSKQLIRSNSMEKERLHAINDAE